MMENKLKVVAPILILFVLLIACTERKEETTFYNLAKNYAEFMIENGQDQYGENHTPAFVSMLDRKTHSLIENPQEQIHFTRQEVGVRGIDRSWNATNPFNDEALHVLLYQLTEDTGDEKYEAAADNSLAWIVNNTQHPETKLIAWGEHIAWDVEKDTVTRHPESDWSDLKHEVHGGWQLWQKVFELAPQAAIDYAEAFWEYHVYDEDKGMHAHQTRYDTYQPDKGYVFPRMVGHMTYVWSLAYHFSEDESVKNAMLHHIDKIVTTHNKRRTSELQTVLFLHPQEGPSYKPFGNIEGVVDLHRALNLSLPDTLKEKLKTYASLSDGSFKKIQSKTNEGIVTLADTLMNIQNVAGGSNLWCEQYGGATPYVKRGMDVLARYQENHDPDFKKMVIKIADEYLDAGSPRCDAYPVWPQSVSMAIDLLLETYHLTGEEKYLDQAIKFGHDAKEMFMDETSPLPKVFSRNFDHYEAISGGVKLMLSFYQLSKESRVQVINATLRCLAIVG